MVGVVEVPWLSVAEAARSLAVSEPRVRQLLRSGELNGQLLGARWLVERASTNARAGRKPAPGRPLGAAACWALLQALAAQPHGAADWSWYHAVADRGLRHRVKGFVAAHPPGEPWHELLRRRAAPQQFWAHPDVLTHLGADRAVSIGGAAAVAAHGHDLGAGGGWLGYLPAVQLTPLVERYALEPDPAGQVALMVIPATVSAVHLPQPGQPVPLITAMIDLLGAADARSAHLAGNWITQLAATLAEGHGDGSRR